MRMFMKKFLIPAIALTALALTACGDSNSAKACQKPAYCYRTTTDSQRHCDLDKAVADTKIQQAKEEGIFKEEFEDCWDM